VAGGAQAYYRTSTGKIIAMVVAVVYIVSPIDLIPDVFLPVGIVDDATALTWLLFALGQEHTRRSRARRALAGRASGGPDAIPGSLPRRGSSR
jgi:uncharacterized membrane protein YkvA (DUF1232 family)